MRRFSATRISQAIGPSLRVPGWEGIVETVHRSAVNLRGGNGLLTLAHESMGGLPNGILLDATAALDQVGLAGGMRAFGDGAALRVPAASLDVSLSGAETWSPAMPVVRGLSPRTRQRRAELARRLAADRAPRVGLGPLLAAMAGGQAPVGSLGRAAAASLARVIRAMRSRSLERALAAAFPLVGLGPGATPSGDDLLVGLAAGLAATGHPLASPFAAGMTRALDGLTTSVSEAYLTHAGRLEFAERVHRTALAVLVGPQAELEAAVNEALAWGASSGADLLVGLLVGIQTDTPGLEHRLRTFATERAVLA
jgi:Protein of unknown function (DUF2877)